jgi:2-phospho-L-lactate guanylyltransferase
MKFVIVPVKDLSQAKNRLSSLLPQDVRTDIAYAMLEDVLKALGSARLPDRKLVVTMDKRAAEIARGLGIDVLEETEQKGESLSVDEASVACKKMGATSVLVIPGDAPLITASDIDAVLERELPPPSAVLVPARDYMGTNAILRNPPDAPGGSYRILRESEDRARHRPSRGFKRIRVRRKRHDYTETSITPGSRG